MIKLYRNFAEVVLLRKEGVKLPEAEVLQAQPYRGFLSYMRGGGFASLTHTPDVQGGHHAFLVPPLIWADLKIDYRGVVIFGRERQRQTELGYWPQAWWVRFIGEGSPPPVEPLFKQPRPDPAVMQP